RPDRGVLHGHHRGKVSGAAGRRHFPRCGKPGARRVNRGGGSGEVAGRARRRSGEAGGRRGGGAARGAGGGGGAGGGAGRASRRGTNRRGAPVCSARTTTAAARSGGIGRGNRRVYGICRPRSRSVATTPGSTVDTPIRSARSSSRSSPAKH